MVKSVQNKSPWWLGLGNFSHNEKAKVTVEYGDSITSSYLSWLPKLNFSRFFTAISEFFTEQFRGSISLGGRSFTIR